MALFVSDAEARWLIITNAALGIVVLIALLVALGSVIYHFSSIRNRRAKAIRGVDDEMLAMFGKGDDHAFRTPELGLTMADGGEPLDTQRKAR